MPSARRRWRDYRTASGRRPVAEFIAGLGDRDAAAVLAGMADVRDRGLRAARHLDGEVWEVRVDGDRVIYRVLFAQEGARGQVLLALEAFNKKTRQTPPATIALARRRLDDWRKRGASMRRLNRYLKRDTVRDMSSDPDFLDEMIAKRTEANPEFPQLLEAARRRRELMHALAERRTAQQRSQTAIAAAMETSQSFVARLESAATDAKVSTIDRYAGSLGYVVQYHLIPADEQGRATPAVVVH